jgi:glycosyltransferase involved in cell wall biosynthesis
MPAAPRVSVLMPSFEQSHFLPRALASLQAQTLSEWQAIIVDDGSQDATCRTTRDWGGR